MCFNLTLLRDILVYILYTNTSSDRVYIDEQQMNSIFKTDYSHFRDACTILEKERCFSIIESVSMGITIENIQFKSLLVLDAIYRAIEHQNN